MSDHFSGPRALADPSCDICDLYAFPSPERPGHLVLAVNVFPFAGPTALFSDAVMCRFRLRPVTIAQSGGTAAFAVGDTEATFDCRFDVPVQREGSTVQDGHCTTPAGDVVSVVVNNGNGTRGKGVSIFAGLRCDPFFFDRTASLETVQTRRLAFKEVGNNDLAGKNVLSLVLEIDAAAVLGSASMLAVVAETLTVGDRPVRLERVGRPEIKNVTLRVTDFDTVNPDLEIRDLYNDEDAFALRAEQLGTYRARFNANLALFDGLDGTVDWPLLADGSHPLTELLLHDFLVVDVSKPFTDGTSLEIERAMLAGRTPATCGGRWLNDNYMDSYYTMLINAGSGAPISDGLTQATVPASYTFPYLAPPNAAL
jgi:hypothetical protein